MKVPNWNMEGGESLGVSKALARSISVVGENPTPPVLKGLSNKTVLRLSRVRELVKELEFTQKAWLLVAEMEVKEKR